MSNTVTRMTELLYKHLQDGLEDPEKAELERWVAELPVNRQVLERLENKQLLSAELAVFDAFESDRKAALAKILEGLPQKEPVPLFPWKRSIAIAAGVMTLIAGVYMWKTSRLKNDIAANGKVSAPKADVAPGHEGAILTLAGGQTIVLDDAAAGALATQGSTQLIKKSNGQLVYNPAGEAAKATIYNELRTPRGRSFKLTLPDGSDVWLNAASSIRYPVAFAGKERGVEVTGEAYFEVAHNAEKPFIVHVSSPHAGQQGTDVVVYGTHFNIMAYGEEGGMKTTLLEGSIGIRSTGGDQRPTVLRPGQQAVIMSSTRPGSTMSLPKNVIVLDDADTDEAVAWKNGLFNFKETDIPAMMRQIARWYDVDIVYEGKIPEFKTTGRVSRNISLATLLNIVELSGVHIVIEGRKIRVMP